MKAPLTSFEFLLRPRTLSFFALVLVFVLVGWLHLATPLLSVLFSCFVLGKIYWALGRIKVTGKWATIAVFAVVLVSIAFGLGKFVKQAVVALPNIASIVVPSVIEWTKARDIELPFTNYEDLKKLLMDTAKDQAHYIGNVANFAKGATTQFVFLIIGGLLAPGSTGAAKFDVNTVIEFNIDNNADAIEDLVIQCKYDAASNSMQVYGPILPSEKGARSKLEGSVTASAVITAYGAAPTIGTGGGIKVFAGPRDDPFFFDLNRFKGILAGTFTGFANPGTDAFAGTNVLSIVVEVPKTMLGGSGSINVWLEAKKKI